MRVPCKGYKALPKPKGDLWTAYIVLNLISPKLLAATLQTYSYFNNKINY